MYVEMDDLNCEGMVSLKSLDDDHYFFDQKAYSIVGSNTEKIYNVGDKVIVKIASVSVAKKQVDLTMIN